MDFPSPTIPITGATARQLAELDEFLDQFVAAPENGKTPNGAPLPNAPSRTPETQAAQGFPASRSAPKKDPLNAAPVCKAAPLSPSPLSTTRKTRQEPLTKKVKAKRENEARREFVEAARFKHGTRAGGDLLSDAPERRSLPRWRDLGVEGRALAAHDFLASQGTFYPFSLELDAATRAAARAAPSFAAHMRDRITRELSIRFPGREIPFAFVVEIRTASGKDREHLHGLAGFELHEAELVEAALRAAGGLNWKQKRRGDRQVDFSRFRTPDEGWLPGYASKSASYTQRKIKGGIIAATKKVNDGAKAMFEAWRENEISKIQHRPAAIIDNSFMTYCPEPFATANNSLDTTSVPRDNLRVNASRGESDSAEDHDPERLLDRDRDDRGRRDHEHAGSRARRGPGARSGRRDARPRRGPRRLERPRNPLPGRLTIPIASGFVAAIATLHTIQKEQPVMAYHYLDALDYGTLVSNLVDHGATDAAAVVETLGRHGILPKAVEPLITGRAPMASFDRIQLVEEKPTPRWIDTFEDQLPAIRQALYDLVDEFRDRNPSSATHVAKPNDGERWLHDQMTRAAANLR
ncbi:hypothetical protein [Aureimonas leprariae]|uniref:Uncharacterized protein n=1 Tax=Plantimonas leprariae TaxID=2615207 RepID=A0A7V7TW83_9HYPH|nr:hypothetical protein [Aureimonas leprariae]KAB0679530.1 hypothetical protein F6X38_11925 [Aureimonas leprariae]